MRRLPEYAIPPPLDSTATGSANESGDSTSIIVSSSTNVSGVLMSGCLFSVNAEADTHWDDNLVMLATVHIPAGAQIEAQCAIFTNGFRVLRLFAGSRVLAQVATGGKSSGIVTYHWDLRYRLLP